MKTLRGGGETSALFRPPVEIGEEGKRAEETSHVKSEVFAALLDGKSRADEALAVGGLFLRPFCKRWGELASTGFLRLEASIGKGCSSEK